MQSKPTAEDSAAPENRGRPPTVGARSVCRSPRRPSGPGGRGGDEGDGQGVEIEIVVLEEGCEEHPVRTPEEHGPKQMAKLLCLSFCISDDSQCLLWFSFLLLNDIVMAL